MIGIFGQCSYVGDRSSRVMIMMIMMMITMRGEEDIEKWLA